MCDALHQNWSPLFFLWDYHIFKVIHFIESAHWADSVLKLQCPSTCLSASSEAVFVGLTFCGLFILKFLCRNFLWKLFKDTLGGIFFLNTCLWTLLFFYIFLNLKVPFLEISFICKYLMFQFLVVVIVGIFPLTFVVLCPQER